MGIFQLVNTPEPSSLASLGRRNDMPADGSDKHLISASIRGEEKAMELLYHRYKGRVFGVVMRIVGHQEAEEVSQEAFIRIFRGLSKFRGDSKFSTWVYRLSVNAALSHVAKKKPVVVSDEILASKPAPDAPRRDSALAKQLNKALLSLSPGYRTVLVLHDVEGLSHEECAKILGCRVGTSKSQLHKARGKMRKILTELGIDPSREGIS